MISSRNGIRRRSSSAAASSSTEKPFFGTIRPTDSTSGIAASVPEAAGVK